MKKPISASLLHTAVKVPAVATFRATAPLLSSILLSSILLSSIVLSSIVFGGFSASTAQASQLDIGSMAPNFTLKSDTGENLRLGEFAGNVRVVVFTASWCGTRNDALRSLQTLAPQMQHYGFQVWAVNLDKDPEQTRSIARQLQLGYPMLSDDEGRVAKQYWIDDLPAVFLVDRDGRIRDELEGDAAKNTARIAETLKRIAEE